MVCFPVRIDKCPICHTEFKPEWNKKGTQLTYKWQCKHSIKEFKAALLKVHAEYEEHLERS